MKTDKKKARYKCLNVLSNDPRANTYTYGGDFGAKIKKKYDWAIDFFGVSNSKTHLILEGSFRNRDLDLQNDMLMKVEADAKLIKGLKYIIKKYGVHDSDIPMITQLLEVMYQEEIEKEYERYYDGYKKR